MAAPGVSGIAAALFVYVLITSNISYTVTGQTFDDRYFPYGDIKLSWAPHLRASHVNKHFGFGRYALAVTLIHPHLFSQARGRVYKTVLQQQQSLAFIIAICLLLSGDIHQCPGPLSAPAQTGPRVSSTHSRSNTGNLQVCPPCTQNYTLEQPTHLPDSIFSASTVGLPMTGTVAMVSSMEEESGFSRRDGLFTWEAPCMLTPSAPCATARNSGNVAYPVHGTAVQQKSPYGSNNAGENSPTRQMLQLHLHSSENKANISSLTTTGSTTKQNRKLTTNLAVVKNRKWNVFRTVNNSKIIWDSSIKPKGLLGGHLNVRSLI